MSTMTFETLRGRMVAGILALALLLCHGVFGSMHLSHDTLPTPPAMESGAHAGASAEHEEAPVSHHGGMAPEYFAVSLALLFGSAFMLLRSNTASSISRTSPLHSKILPRPAAFRPSARGPTPPYLQVFRL